MFGATRWNNAIAPVSFQQLLYYVRREFVLHQNCMYYAAVYLAFWYHVNVARSGHFFSALRAAFRKDRPEEVVLDVPGFSDTSLCSKL